MKLPTYSVVIPLYNCEKTIKKSIESVLNQSYAPLEIIVIDDMSTDNSFDIILSLTQKNKIIKAYQNKKNIGVAKTRNYGMSLSLGEYIAFLDSDDYWLPFKMKKQLNLMIEKQCQLSYTSYILVSKDTQDVLSVYDVPCKITLKDMIAENFIGCSTAVFLREIAQEYKMNSDYAHEDYVFWLEILQKINTACGISVPCVRYTIDPNSRSGNKIKSAKNRWIIYRKFLKMNFINSLFAFIKYAVNGIKNTTI